MKVLGVLGSPRIGGNSDILLEQALAGARDAGAEAEKIILCRKKISGCLNCEKCNETGICSIKDDMPEIHKKILEADLVIHSVPVYFWAMTAQMKAYLDRWCAFYDANWEWHKAYAPKMKGKKIGLNHRVRRRECLHWGPDCPQLQDDLSVQWPQVDWRGAGLGGRERRNRQE